MTTLAETPDVSAALTVLNPIEIAPIVVEPLGSVTVGRSTSVTNCLQTLASAAVLATALGGPVAAQEPPEPVPDSRRWKPLVALKLQVVVSRYQGEKKISSLPYTLSVNNDHTLSRLRMGSKVAVLTVPRPPEADDKNNFRIQFVHYQDVGTNIDCYALSTDDGRFRIEITIQDTSVYSDAEDQSAG